MSGYTRSMDSCITLQIQQQASKPQSSQPELQLHSQTVWSQQSVLQLRCEDQYTDEISFFSRIDCLRESCNGELDSR